MAKTPIGSTGTVKIPASKSGDVAASSDGVGAVAIVDVSDPAGPILLEFESPTAALLAQPVPLRSRYMTWVMASMVMGFVIVSGTIKIDRIATTSGKVVATAANVVVQPLETAIVRSIEVKEGQVVHAGDVLARLDPTFATADAGALEMAVSSLQAEVNRLQAEVDDKPYLTDGSAASQLQAMIYTQKHAERAFKVENYNQKIDAARVKIAQAQSDIVSYGARLTVATTVEDKRRELERLQVGSSLNTLAATDSKVEAGRQVASAKAQLESSRREYDALVAERDGFVQQSRNESSQQLTEQGRKLGESRENLNKARLRRNLVELRADREAIVLTVAPVNVGSVLQSGDQFFTLVPVDSPLEVETVLDARDAGFVKVGDDVVVKFETFPYFVYGTAEGLVRNISPDSFRRPMDDRDKVSKPRSEEAAGTFYYRARISLDQINLKNLPPGFRLSPGMPVTGDIKIGKRTIIQYLFSRVIPATTEGMREP